MTHLWNYVSPVVVKLFAWLQLYCKSAFDVVVWSRTPEAYGKAFVFRNWQFLFCSFLIKKNTRAPPSKQGVSNPCFQKEITILAQHHIFHRDSNPPGTLFFDRDGWGLG